ncbi:MAG: NAD(P)H-dependent oxidoreductase subunit E [Tepidisphaerales bacterium]
MPATLAHPLDLSPVDRIVERTGRSTEAAIGILHAIQEHYHYLPKQALERVCETTQISPAQLVGVATFYAQFRHEPAGKHFVRICHGTACHVKGSELVEDSIRRCLNLTNGDDTDADGTFTMQRVGCLGCCTLAPVVQIGDVVYGHRLAENAAASIQDFLSLQTAPPEKAAATIERIRRDGPATEIRIGTGSCCVAGGAANVKSALERAVARSGANAVVKTVGCVGMCHQIPLVEVGIGGAKLSLYNKVTTAQANDIVRRHVPPQGLWRRMRERFSSVLDHLVAVDEVVETDRHAIGKRDQSVCEFLGSQKRIATEFCGELGPLDVDEYLAHNGFVATRRALSDLTPGQIVDQVKTSGLRGRGGAGFPTGQKWAITAGYPADRKYIICNGDEGDPGAFMDRMILESFPYRVIEGMIVASKAVGAHEGIFYIRAEYPLAVQRVGKAIEICMQRGLLGDDIMCTDHSLHVRIVQGAGAFVCGEETALIASIEGQRGMPRLRPPYPAESGLHGKPTCINNVETLAMVPWIIRNGGPAFAAIGTPTSKGTKVFALTGKIARGGLIEVPMGITIRQIVEDIGGGIAHGRKFKAVQIGGPSGGCIPAELGDLPVEYESLAKAGAIMGSGGLVVLDDSDCMVDMARYFLKFTQAESCGKCTLCRVGTKVMLDILDKLCAGKAKPADLKKLEELCGAVRAGSICGLGQTAPNPVLTTLKYFRDEYEAHLNGHCPAGRCKGLIKYVVNDKCIGCTKCAQVCPAGAIEMRPYLLHEIELDKCTRCDMCRSACPETAITIV